MRKTTKSYKWDRWSSWGFVHTEKYHLILNQSHSFLTNMYTNSKCKLHTFIIWIYIRNAKECAQRRGEIINNIKLPCFPKFVLNFKQRISFLVYYISQIVWTSVNLETNALRNLIQYHTTLNNEEVFSKSAGTPLQRNRRGALGCSPVSHPLKPPLPTDQ